MAVSEAPLRACPRVSPHPYLYEDDVVVTMEMPARPLPPVWPPKEKNWPPKEKNKPPKEKNKK
jgi:hypothetical protein